MAAYVNYLQSRLNLSPVEKVKADTRILLASNNIGKLREIKAVLSGSALELISQSAYEIDDADETGLSFVENAIIKARHAARHVDFPVIADDSGIEVDVLQGAPGIYSARYAGSGASDEDNLNLLLKNVKQINVSQAKARFQCVMVYLRHELDPVPLIAQGTWEGYLVNEKCGSKGFGYDPIFYVPTHGCTSAELPSKEKNAISHRAQALRALVAMLPQTNQSE